MVAMISAGMVQMTGDEIILMIAMRNHVVTASGTMLMGSIMAVAFVFGRAL